MYICVSVYFSIRFYFTFVVFCLVQVTLLFVFFFICSMVVSFFHLKIKFYEMRNSILWFVSLVFFSHSMSGHFDQISNFTTYFRKELVSLSLDEKDWSEFSSEFYYFMVFFMHFATLNFLDFCLWLCWWAYLCLFVRHNFSCQVSKGGFL